ncbi:MAG: hypothetical protein HKO62_08650 [Gammaproteobacteria bacterium]|nr:hypothetical protein [Gammaproteobacteria bacterium]
MATLTHTVRLTLMATLLGFSGGAMAMLGNTFSTPNNSEGWQVLNYIGGFLYDTAPGETALWVSEGNPGGSVRAEDPNDFEGARFLAPVAGDLSSFIGETLRFDLKVIENFDPNEYTVSPQFGIVLVEGPALTLAYTDINPDDDWNRYEIPLTPSAGPLVLVNSTGTTTLPPIPDLGFWVVYQTNNLLGGFALATQSDFDTVFADVDRLTIIGEVLDGPEDKLALDNVFIPVPAALPLLLSALVGLGFTSGRRRA